MYRPQLGSVRQGAPVARPAVYAQAPAVYAQPQQYAQPQAVQYAQPQPQPMMMMGQPGGFGMVQQRVDPGLQQIHARITQLLQNPQDLKTVINDCIVAVVGSPTGEMDLRGLQALCMQVQARTGLPPQAFGNLPDTYMRFDFNGNGMLGANEAYKCVKTCMLDFRKSTGLDPPTKVPTMSPTQAGYQVIKVLAAGGQGEASLCRVIATGEELVLKSYNRGNENAGGLDELLDEAEHMKTVAGSPYVAHCLDIFQDPNFFYMVSGANMGGDWCKIKTKAASKGVQITEDWYRDIFTQALEGLKFMHSQAIMHCDLKEPNLMLANDDYANPQVVIIDLGLSQAMSTASEGPCGTPGYIPPETWSGGKWFPRGDMFSFGVVCIQLLTDKIPDEKTNAAGIFSEGCQSMDDVIQVTSTREPPWQLLQIRNPACQQFLAACVAKDIQRRPRAPQVLEMPFFTRAAAPVMPVMPQFAQPVTYAAPPVQYAAAPRAAPVTYAAPPVTYAAPQVQYAAAPTYAAAPRAARPSMGSVRIMR